MDGQQKSQRRARADALRSRKQHSMSFSCDTLTMDRVPPPFADSRIHSFFCLKARRKRSNPMAARRGLVLLKRGLDASASTTLPSRHYTCTPSLLDKVPQFKALGVTNTNVRERRIGTSSGNLLSSSSANGAGRRRGSAARKRHRPAAISGADASVVVAELAAAAASAGRKSRGGVRIIYEQPLFAPADDVETSHRIKVKAVHAAQSIDIMGVLGKVFGGTTSRQLNDLGIGAPIRHVFGKNHFSVLFQLPPPEPTPGQRADPSPRFVAVFKFGSVVFHNCTTQEIVRILAKIKRHATDPVSYGFEKTERFEVAVQPELAEASGDVTSEYAAVKELEIHSVAVISKIMASSVALDSYADTVDELLAAFSTINSQVKSTGEFSPMDKETLFKVVAQNNSLMMNIIGKLGIKDKSDIAWELAEYESVYEGMKKEFEIEDRFDNIEFKLNIIQSNAKFFLEVLAHQKSTSLEWIIVVLIAFESILMILEMSGHGEKIFSGLLG